MVIQTCMVCFEWRIAHSCDWLFVVVLMSATAVWCQQFVKAFLFPPSSVCVSQAKKGAPPIPAHLSMDQLNQVSHTAP